MTKATYLARCAPIAVAAMAALGSTPGLAQDASSQPVIVLPSDPVVAPDPAPVPQSAVTPGPIVSPVEAAPQTAPQPLPTRSVDPIKLDPPKTQAKEPTVKAAKEQDAASAAPVQRNNASDSASTAVSAAERSAPTQPSEGVVSTSPSDDPLLHQDSVADVNGTAAARDNLAPPAQNADPSTIALLAGLGGLAVLIAGLAMLIRRRRRRVSEPMVAERAETVTPRAEPAFGAAQPVAPIIDREPTVTRYDEPAYSPVAEGNGEGGLPNEGAAVSLPSEMPESYEERDALLKRMVDADPDRANPFRSRKARTKRARLIMQSLSRSFENRKPRFDLSQYTSNWPALKGWHPATA